MAKTTSNLSARLASALKDCGVEIVSGGSAMQSDVTNVVSTGSLLLNTIIGGGIPYGRIVELFGVESGGKTSLLMSILREAQRSGADCVLIDAESSFNRKWAARLGIDVDALTVAYPETLEQSVNVIDQLAKLAASSKRPIVCGFDSIAASPTQRELDSDGNYEGMADQARVISRACRKLAGKIGKSKLSLILVNQLRDKVGMVFGARDTTPGGRAIRFYSSIRLRVERVQTLKKGERAIGILVKITVVKSKVCDPFRSVELPLWFESGLDDAGSVKAFALKKKLIGADYNGNVLEDDALVARVREALGEENDDYETLEDEDGA